MSLASFRIANQSFWNEYFGQVHEYARLGMLESPPSTIRLYPQSILLTETPDHYIAELIGAQTKFRALKHKTHRIGSTDLYFNQFAFPDPPDVGFELVSVSKSGFSGMLIMPAGSDEEVRRRYPGLRARYETTLLRDSPGDVAGFSISADSTCNFFEDITAVNRLGIAIRARHLRLATIISRTENIPEYVAFLREHFAFRDAQVVRGLLTAKAQDEASVVTAGQLSNLFLMDRLHETNLTDFLESHEEIVLHALGAQDLRFQPKLHWRDGNPDPTEFYIQPDLLVQRTNGRWDVCDAKLALLPRKKLTKRERRRRQLIDTVAEGVAQLAHYRDYFSYEANRAEALEKYQIDVAAPAGVLIVGHYENADQREIAEALRAFDDLEIIDWDSLLQLYLGEKGHAGPENPSASSVPQ